MWKDQRSNAFVIEKLRNVLGVSFYLQSEYHIILKRKIMCSEYIERGVKIVLESEEV